MLSVSRGNSVFQSRVRLIEIWFLKFGKVKAQNVVWVPLILEDCLQHQESWDG